MKVKFVPQNVQFEIKAGESVMHLAQDNGLYIKSVCKGVPSCAECRVRVVEGDHNVMPPGSEELSLIGTGHFIDQRRLSCQLKCFGDITVDMHEQLDKQNALNSGPKKKLSSKDDRVEAVVRRGDPEAPSGDALSNETFVGDEASILDSKPLQKPLQKPPQKPSSPASRPLVGARPSQGPPQNESRDGGPPKRRRRRGKGEKSNGGGLSGGPPIGQPVSGPIGRPTGRPAGKPGGRPE